MVVYEQDGCPYCAQMHQVHFKDKAIVASLKKNFDVLQLDIWGGREVSDFNGAAMTEKELARKLRVQFSPTIAFYDTHGKEIFRMAGLHKPPVFKAELDYLSGHAYEKMSFNDYASRLARKTVAKGLIDEPFFAKRDNLKSLAEKAWAQDKLLALLFVQPQCSDCQEMHDLYFTRSDTVNLLNKHFEVVRIDLTGKKMLTGLSGASTTEAELTRVLSIQQTPTMVFFDRSGREILRYEEHLTPDNFTNGLLTYLGTHAYRQYDTLQDWLRIMAAQRAAQK